MSFVREAEYRVNFLLGMGEGAAQLALPVVTFLLIARFTPRVAGWSQAQVLLLVGVYRIVDGARAAVELVPLVREVGAAVPVPIVAVISDGQGAIGNAVRTALPGLPHPLGQLRYVREATKPLVDADGPARVDSVNTMTGLVRKADCTVVAGPARVSG